MNRAARPLNHPLSPVQQDTISINHNWCNACGIDLMWAHLKREHEAVQHEVWLCSVP